MQYDLSNEWGRQRCRARLDDLTRKGAVVSLTEKTFRTTRQNSYLHLIIGVVAMEVGVSLDYAKEEYYKRLVNRDIFEVVRKDPLAGEVHTLRSSAELTKEEMSMSVDRFKRWAAENGIYLPSPTDEAILRDIAVQLGSMTNYIGG